MAGAGSFIQPDNIWALWAILIGIAAGSIALEQKYQWAAKLTEIGRASCRERV